MRVALLVLAVAATGRAVAIPTGEEHKDRVKDKKLSEQDHFENQEHKTEYDHEAFLGKEESKRFDELSPEESLERLGKIVDKIDKDHDGKVTNDELQTWIRYVSKRYILQDAERQWKDHDIEHDKITWDAYKSRVYGGFSEEQLDNEPYNYKDMMRRDQRRWEKADTDSDNALTKEEFANFLHPEDVEHMRDVVVDETIEDIDKDKDGKISLKEYIQDMWPEGSEGEEPEWVKTEREQFTEYRDKNKDGFMDRDEIRDWIIPPDYDHADAEAKHLIYESDEDKDGVLTKDEILKKHELFVGSQATDYGDALMRHEEL